MNDEELEAYLRKHTLNGQMREVHDRGTVLVRLFMQELTRFLIGVKIVLERLRERLDE